MHRSYSPVGVGRGGWATPYGDPVSVSSPAWPDLRVVETTGSTNSDLAAVARAGGAAGTALVAWEQTGGRGRLARQWSSPPGTSASISVLLRPDRPRDEWGVLPLVTGLGVVDGVERLGVEAVLKWPNDVLLPGDENHKVCGILAEMVGPDPYAVVVGVGLNIGQTREQLPVETATSLRLAGADVTREVAVSAVLDGMGEAFLRWERGGWRRLATAYAERCTTIGREVRVELPAGGAVTGTAAGITGDGRLRLRTAVGEQAYAAGDVHHVRPAARH